MSTQTVFDEHARQRALDAYRLVDTLPEMAYDDIVRLAGQICRVPVALITLLDHDRQWFKAKVGIDLQETPRDVAFCDHAIREPGSLMEITDARLDPRFRDNPLVTGEAGIRFYAGVPLLTPSGEALGTVCVIDQSPQVLDDAQKSALQALARLTVTLMEVRRKELQQQRADSDRAFRRLDTDEAAPGAVAIVELDNSAGLLATHGADVVARLRTELVAAIQAQLGPRDIVSAHGEHEWLLILDQATQARTLLAAVHAAVSRIRTVQGVRTLIGAACARDGGEAMEMLFLRADDALARARASDQPVVID